MHVRSMLSFDHGCIWSWVYLDVRLISLGHASLLYEIVPPFLFFFPCFCPLHHVFGLQDHKSGLAISTWLPKNTPPSGQACFAKPWLHTDKFANLAGFSLRKITGNPKKGILAKKSCWSCPKFGQKVSIHYPEWSRNEVNKHWTDTFLVPIAWTVKNISSRCLCIFTRRITGFNSRPQRRNPKFSAWEFLQIFAPFSIISGINCWGALILWNSRVHGFSMFYRLVSQTLSDPDLFLSLAAW